MSTDGTVYSKAINAGDFHGDGLINAQIALLKAEARIEELEAAALPDGRTRIDGKVYEVLDVYELDAYEPQPGTTIWNRCLVLAEDTP